MSDVPARSERPRRVLKVVLGFDCENRCPYCAVIRSPGWPAARKQVLDPVVAEPKLADAAARYDITALEVGAGESFLHPELFEWLVDWNNRQLGVPVVLFASLDAPHVDRVFDALARNRAGAFVLVSYDGPHSERNAENWRAIERAFRRRRADLRETGVRLKITACVTPDNVGHLDENFRAIAALAPDAPRFNFRPIKRVYTPAQVETMCAQYASFLSWARVSCPGVIEAPEHGRVLRYELKPDWACHHEGVSLLPDGRWTDCYVTYYCSDYPPSRTVPTLDGYDAIFDAKARPRLARCRRCLDAYSFCNQCEAGLADFRRTTGESFYDMSFCVLINRLAALTLAATFDRTPDARVMIDRGPAGCLRVRAAGDGFAVTDAAGTTWVVNQDNVEAGLNP